MWRGKRDDDNILLCEREGSEGKLGGGGGDDSRGWREKGGRQKKAGGGESEMRGGGGGEETRNASDWLEHEMCCKWLRQQTISYWHCFGCVDGDSSSLV